MFKKVEELIVVDLMGLESQVEALDGGTLLVGLAKTEQLFDDKG